MEYARETILFFIIMGLIVRVVISTFILLNLKYYDEEYTGKDIFIILLIPLKVLFDFVVGDFPYEHNPEEQIKIWERKIKDYEIEIKILEKEIEETKKQLKKEN